MIRRLRIRIACWIAPELLERIESLDRIITRMTKEMKALQMKVREYGR